MRSTGMHATYDAMLEVGSAQRTIFVCRNLRDRTLQRNTDSGLNVLNRPGRLEQLTPAEHRGLTPLFWTHIKPDGDVRPDMTRLINL